MTAAKLCAFTTIGEKKPDIIGKLIKKEGYSSYHCVIILITIIQTNIAYIQSVSAYIKTPKNTEQLIVCKDKLKNNRTCC